MFCRLLIIDDAATIFHATLLLRCRFIYVAVAACLFFRDTLFFRYAMLLLFDATVARLPCSLQRVRYSSPYAFATLCHAHMPVHTLAATIC